MHPSVVIAISLADKYTGEVLNWNSLPKRQRRNREGAQVLFGKQKRKTKMALSSRVLHLYDGGKSFMVRLMCSAKRRNKIKAKRRSVGRTTGGRKG